MQTVPPASFNYRQRIGFQSPYTEKIFEMFYRHHGKGEYEGTGIGIAIVRKIAENRNGIITASSEPKRAMTFIPATII